MSRDSRRHARQFQNTYSWLYPETRCKTVTFIVTHQCNLRCTYCYEGHKSNKKMTLETAKKCVDLLFEQDAQNSELVNDRDANGLIIEFIGGEPFLEIDLIGRTMEYFLDRAIALDHRWQTRYMINISTNGTLGDDPQVQAFMRRYAGRLSIGVTIDGDKAAHDACRVDCNGCGSYDRAIKMFRQTGGEEKHTKYTIAPGNLHLFAASVRHLCLEEGVYTLNCNCVYEEGWTREHAKELYRQLKEVSDMLRESGTDTYVSILDWEAGNPMPDTDTQNWCGGDGRMLAFDVDGTVLPCMRYSTISIPEEDQPLYRIGDVDSGLAVREDDRERLAALRSITRQSQSEQRCLDCPIASGCAWCTAYNYQRTGTPDRRVTYICEMHKARVLAQCYHHNMLHLKNPEHKPKKMNIPRAWALPIVGEEEYRMLLELAEKAEGVLTNGI